MCGIFAILSVCLLVIVFTVYAIFVTVKQCKKNNREVVVGNNKCGACDKTYWISEQNMIDGKISCPYCGFDPKRNYQLDIARKYCSTCANREEGFVVGNQLSWVHFSSSRDYDYYIKSYAGCNRYNNITPEEHGENYHKLMTEPCPRFMPIKNAE